MTGGNRLEQISITLRDRNTGNLLPVYIDVYDNTLSRKWLAALNDLLLNGYHLEKNYCFFGFADGERDGEFLLDKVNETIAAINKADLGYQINDHFTMDNTMTSGEIGPELPGGRLIHDKFNHLHRYFEDLQGQSGRISAYAAKASPEIKWHIRQLNLLCHEFESWALSYRKKHYAPEWQRPSQLMCWLNAPRFLLEEQDFELFGIDTLNRPLGGVFMGVNKSVGKHHWEVFNDEGRDSRIGELTTSALISQTEGAGDFDIEWANNPGDFPWQKIRLAEFRDWLVANGFDPEDKSLTIGHPQVGQVDLIKSFGTEDYQSIWSQLNTHLDVYQIETSQASISYEYCWADSDFMERQINIISKGH